MIGIDLNKPVLYRYASFRFFQKKEHHVTRFCSEDVLLLVYDGVLRFSEDGEEQEVCAGEYYIQRKNRLQDGAVASDAPKYLYVHFDGVWTDSADALAYRGSFDVQLLFDLMSRLDSATHQKEPYCDKQYLFLKLLLSLRKKPEKKSLVRALIGYVDGNIQKNISLSDICEEFHYSKNYVIQIFNREFGMSPIQYINEVRIQRAMYLLETTSRPIAEIADDCGYSDYAYFYKRFLEKTGASPLAWRRQIRGIPHMDE